MGNYCLLSIKYCCMYSILQNSDIQQSSSAAEQQPMATTQRATADQSSKFVAPEPTRAKQSGLLSKDNNQFGSVTGKQPVKEPSKPMPTTGQQQQTGSGMASNTNETSKRTTDLSMDFDVKMKTTGSKANQGIVTSGGGGASQHEDEFYGSAIEQRKAPMSNAAPTSTVAQQQQPQTSDTAPTATGTYSRKDSRVISDLPPSSHQQPAGQSETAAIPPSSQQQQPCQKVQFSSDAPQQKQASSQPPPLNTKTQPTAAPTAAPAPAPATATNTNKSDGAYTADQGILAYGW